MSKLLMFGLLAVIVYLLLRNLARRQGKPPGTPPAQKMVICAHCGVHLPESESLNSGELHYCCEQHRGLGPLER